MKNNYTKLLPLIILICGLNLGFSQATLSRTTYGGIIQDYLNEVKNEYGFTDSDIADLYLNNEANSKKAGLVHYYVNQRYNGIRVFNAVSSIAIKNGEVFNFSNGFVTNVASNVNTLNPSITPNEAIFRAMQEFGIGNTGTLELVESGENTFVYNNSNISQSKIPVELMLMPIENGSLQLVWDLNIDTINGKHWWSVRVDAITGEVLNYNDWVISCDFGSGHTHSGSEKSLESSFSLFKNQSYLTDNSQYNIFPLPFESPTDGGRQLVMSPADLTASPYGWHDTNGIAGAEYTITRGNNVWAQDDTDGNNTTTGYSPDGTASLNFDFPLDLNQAPSGYLDASITNLFYANNIMHDVWYQYGFDELSGNFQVNNYGNGGTGNDYVVAQAQDGAGMDNANFATPIEGSSPRMQMYIWGAYGIPEPLTINNGPLAGNYIATYPATGIGNNITPPSTTPITADLALVDDSTAAPTEACSALTNGPDVNGKIAVIKRGNCTFVEKIQNAQDAGAVAVIMVNHNNPDNDPNYVEYVNMAGTSTPAFTIPSIFVNYADGEPIITALMGGQTINATIVNNGPYEKDGSLDNGIVFHEYGHGISSRLTGGSSNSNCLTNGEQMGEGWSDWFALMLTIKASDQGTDARGIASYAVGQPITGLGIRPAYYTTDFSLNDYTFGATNDNTVIGTDGSGNDIRWNEIVHNIGFVWATILWDMTWAYIDKYGFDPDFYNGTGGNNKAMQVVIDALKLQPCNPNFVAGRNAILDADMALTGGEDQCLIWEVFANRGLGVNASSGLPFLMTDQVEDFTMPDPEDPSLANCTTLSTEDFNNSDFKIYPNPTSNELNIKVNGSLGEVNILMIDINGRVVYNEVTTLDQRTTLNTSNLRSGVYILKIVGDNITINEKVVIK